MRQNKFKVEISETITKESLCPARSLTFFSMVLPNLPNLSNLPHLDFGFVQLLLSVLHQKSRFLPIPSLSVTTPRCLLHHIQPLQPDFHLFLGSRLMNFSSVNLSNLALVSHSMLFGQVLPLLPVLYPTSPPCNLYPQNLGLD